MGAGSKFCSPKEQRDYYNETHPNKTKKNCKFHYLIYNTKYGICRFLNTGRPYMIKTCPECERDYVKEIMLWNYNGIALDYTKT